MGPTLAAVVAEPEVVTVKRYRCPFCRRSHSRPVRARQHMGRCWFNPAAKGCKTCVHFVPAEEQCCDNGAHGCPCLVRDACAVDVDLGGREACGSCGGEWSGCPNCGGNGATVKPGPIVHCPLWALKAEEAAS